MGEGTECAQAQRPELERAFISQIQVQLGGRLRGCSMVSKRKDEAGERSRS